MKKTGIIAIILLIIFLSGSAWVPAAHVETEGLKSIAARYGLDRSDTDDLVRAYRGAVNIGISPKRMQSAIEKALSQDMDLKYLIRAISLITNAALDGLPAGPMLNKFSEGLAKNVDGEDIVEAMEDRAVKLKKARQILSVLIYEDKHLEELDLILIAVASALERGARERTIEKVFKDKGPDLRKIILELGDLK